MPASYTLLYLYESADTKQRNIRPKPLYTPYDIYMTWGRDMAQAQTQTQIQSQLKEKLNELYEKAWDIARKKKMSVNEVISVALFDAAYYRYDRELLKIAKLVDEVNLLMNKIYKEEVYYRYDPYYERYILPYFDRYNYDPIAVSYHVVWRFSGNTVVVKVYGDRGRKVAVETIALDR